MSSQIASSPQFPLSIKKQDFLTTDIVFALLVLGSPRSGKGVLLDSFINKFYKEYFLIWHLYSALGHESLFPIVNKNCRDAWYDEIHKHPGRAKELPACQCYKPIPILLMKPNYIEINKKSLVYGINVVWKDWKEYNDAYEKNQVKEYISPFHWESTLDSMPDRLFKKPKSMYPKQIFKTFDYTPPITGPQSTKNLNQFREEMHKAVSLSKNERRILVNSPGLHAPDSVGKQEKYSVVAESLRYMQDTLYEDPMFDIWDGSDEESATPAQLANHKKMFVINELRGCCPSAKLSGEKESGVSKRAIYNFLPVRRHCKAWSIFDTQSPSDIFDGVRSQLSELKIFKRITFDLIGAENEKFFTRVEKLCNSYYENWGLNPKNHIPLQYKLGLLKRYHLCKLSELPDNMFIIKNASGEFQVKQVKHASFHHKSDTKDEITKILGTKFTINSTTRGLKPAVKDATESKSAVKSQSKEIVMLKVQSLLNEKKSFSEISERIKQLEVDGSIPDLGNGKLSPDALGTKFRRWKKNQDKE